VVLFYLLIYDLFKDDISLHGGEDAAEVFGLGFLPGGSQVYSYLIYKIIKSEQGCGKSL
jgi:hypothetical protein